MPISQQILSDTTSSEELSFSELPSDDMLSTQNGSKEDNHWKNHNWPLKRH